MTDGHRRDDTPRGYRHDEDACLARTAEAVDFARTPDQARADVAATRVDPLGRILKGLLRGIGPRRRSH